MEKNNQLRKIYDKLIETEDGIGDSLTKAASVLTNVSYISNPRVRGALKGINLAIGAGMVCHSMFKYFRETVEDSMYSLVIDDLNEAVFDVAMKFMSEFQEESSIKDYNLRVKYDRIPFSNKTRTIIHTEVDQDSVLRMEFEGYNFQVSLSMPEPPQKGTGDNSMRPVIGVRNITFYCKNLEGVRVIEKEIQSRVDIMSKEDIRPNIMVNGDYGFNTNELRVRPLESVVLKEGQSEAIVNHIDRFLVDEEAHLKYGLPYHTGIMLYGPPGTGKTSTVTGIASHFQMNLYQISLSNIEDDSDLIETFSGVKARSIVVLEDLDVLSKSNTVDRSADAPDEGITMSGLLNVLDGNMTPHGMILFATTNSLESIDPALVRTGRIDLSMEIDYMNDEQLGRLIKYFTGKSFDLPSISVEDKIASSDISGLFRSHLKNPEDAIDSIRELLETKKKVGHIA